MDALEDRLAEKDRYRRRRAALRRVKAKWARRALFVFDGGDIDLLGRAFYSRGDRDLPIVSWEDVAYLRAQFVVHHYSHGSWHAWEKYGTAKDRLSHRDLVADLRYAEGWED